MTDKTEAVQIALATRLISAIDAVLNLHTPTQVEVLTGDCAAEECAHDSLGQCVRGWVTVCAACFKLAVDANPYYGEAGLQDVVHPCRTVQALEGGLTEGVTVEPPPALTIVRT